MPGRGSSRDAPARRRIVIVDDQPLVRRGLIALIDAEPDLLVCAEAATQRAALVAIAASRPDLVIAEAFVADDGRLALVEKVRSGHEHMPVLVLSRHDGPLWAQRAFDAGANGYISKRERIETLLTAIRSVLDGEMFSR